MPRLTVMQLLPALESGGVERSTLEIAQALTAAGHRALVVSAGGRLEPALHACGAEHIRLDIGRKSVLTLRHLHRLRGLFLRYAPDLVHARSRLPAWLGWWALSALPAARRPGFITTVHGLNSPGRYSAIMTRGERVICVSQTVQRYVLEQYPRTDPARLRVIPRGIDPAQFPARPWPDHAQRRQWASRYPALAGEGPLLLLPGRGTRLKGHEQAVTLLGKLRAEGMDARLWMPGAREAGREHYLQYLEQQAAQGGFAHALAITPPTAQIADAYAAADVVLQLSRKPEAFGRTVIEALSVGRPVVGWAHGGVGELLAQWQPQGAVPAFDESALHQSVRNMLLSHPPLPAARMAAYTLSAMQDATLATYLELVDERRTRCTPSTH